MSIRYFRDQDGGVQQHGNLTDEGAGVLAEAGHEEITAEEYQAAEEEARAAAEMAATAAPAAPAAAKERASEPSARKRRR